MVLISCRQALSVEPNGQCIVFDSPVKTAHELRTALAAGVYLNLDNLQELQRVADLLQKHGSEFPTPNIGLRYKDCYHHSDR